MDFKSQYYLQILDVIGAPLLNAVLGQDGDDQAQASEVAALLAKSVQLSIQMGEGFDFAKSADQGDSLRVALAGLAAQVLADGYAKYGRSLSETESGKIVAVLGSVLAFADNFTPSEEATARLDALKADGGLVDAGQADIQYIHAFLPIVSAIAEFSFGQQESKLALEISDRLVKRAVEIRETRLSEIKDAELQKRAEVSILDGMAGLFASCYRAVVKDLSAHAEGGPPAGIEQVWEKFDKQSAILDLMVASVLGESGSVAGSGASDVKPAVAETPSVEPVSPSSPLSPPPAQAIEPDAVLDTQPQKPSIFGAKAPEPEESKPDIPAVDDVVEQASSPMSPPPSPPAQESASPAKAASPFSSFVAKDGGEDPVSDQSVSTENVEPSVEVPSEVPAAAGGNPMSMFAKPKDSDEAVQPSSVSTEPEVVAGSSSPPPSAPSVDDNEGQDETKSGDSGNPMSFFKGGN